MPLARQADKSSFPNRRSALVVDDEPLVALYLSDILIELGFDVVTSYTVNESLDTAFKHGEFSVAFVDLSLPDRSGLELISELQTLYPPMPIVIASGFGVMASRDMAGNARAREVLCKPYEKHGVANVLSTLGFALHAAPQL